MFVAAMNPCPCGYYTDPNRNCRCSPSKIERYAGKGDGETSAAIKEKLRGIVHYRS
jgi:predicted ATPase with chaperone activity